MTWKNGKAPFFALHWRPSKRMQSRYYDDFDEAFAHWVRLYKRREEKGDLKHLSLSEVERHQKEGWSIRSIPNPVAFMARRRFRKGISLDDSCMAREERRKAADG
jgi:hypothetical protein